MPFKSIGCSEVEFDDIDAFSALRYDLGVSQARDCTGHYPRTRIGVFGS